MYGGYGCYCWNCGGGLCSYCASHSYTYGLHNPYHYGYGYGCGSYPVGCYGVGGYYDPYTYIDPYSPCGPYNSYYYTNPYHYERRRHYYSPFHSFCWRKRRHFY